MRIIYINKYISTKYIIKIIINNSSDPQPNPLRVGGGLTIISNIKNILYININIKKVCLLYKKKSINI